MAATRGLVSENPAIGGTTIERDWWKSPVPEGTMGCIAGMRRGPAMAAVSRLRAVKGCVQQKKKEGKSLNGNKLRLAAKTKRIQKRSDNWTNNDGRNNELWGGEGEEHNTQTISSCTTVPNFTSGFRCNVNDFVHACVNPFVRSGASRP